MGQRIMLINPLGVDIFDRITVEIVAPHLDSNTDVVCTSLGRDAPPTPFLAPLDQIRKPLIATALQAERDGFDAVAISCSGDPCLDDVRAALSIPAVGALESACVNARALGPISFLQRRLPEPYPSLMPTQRNSQWLLDKIAGYGVTSSPDDVRTVRVTEHPDPEAVAELAVSDPDGLREIILEAMHQAVSTDGVAAVRSASAAGARAAYFNCTFWGGLLDEVSAQVDIAVLDPLVVVAKQAETVAVIAS